MTNPTVLYVMPVYNGVQWLPAAIESLLNQTYPALQILCIDDGSTDGSSELLQRYEREHSHVRVIFQPRAGPGVAFNQGIRFAHDQHIEFIARMDADDISLPERTRKQVNALQANPAYAACGCFASYFIDYDRTVGHSVVPVSPREIQSEVRAGGRGLIQGATLFRTQMINALGGYRAEKTPAEDTDLFLRLTETYPVTNVPEELYRIRICANSHSLKQLHRTRLYHHYFLYLSRLRAAGQPEIPFPEYESALSTIRKWLVRKEEAAIWAYFRWMTHRSIFSLVLAALLEPGRTVRRIRRVCR